MARETNLTSAADFDRREWLDAFSSSPDSSAYLHPDVMLAGDRSRLFAFRIPGPDSSVAFFELKPTGLVHLPVLGSVSRVETLRLLGSRILGRSDGGVCARFAAEIGRLVGAGALPAVLLESAEVGSDLWGALTAVGGEESPLLVERLGRPQPRWYIEFPADPRLYWERFSTKSVKNIRRSARLLEHAIQRFTLETDVPKLLVALSHVSHLSWQGKRLGVRFSADDKTRATFAALARIGSLRSYVLEHGGRPAAFVHGTQQGTSYSFEETAYVSELAESSPGRVLCYRVIEDLQAENPPQRLDFGHGDAEYKRFFGTRSIDCGPLLLMRRSPRTRALLNLARAIDRVQAVLRERLQRAAQYRRLRRLYRR